LHPRATRGQSRRNRLSKQSFLPQVTYEPQPQPQVQEEDKSHCYCS
jgi:hypothetical protein